MQLTVWSLSAHLSLRTKKAVALHSLATSVYGLLLANNTGEVPSFLAVDDDGEDIEANSTAVTDAPRGRRAAAFATATAGAATNKLAPDLFAGHRAYVGLRPVAGAWAAQRFADAWPSAEGADEDDEPNEDVSDDLCTGRNGCYPV